MFGIGGVKATEMSHEDQRDQQNSACSADKIGSQTEEFVELTAI